MTHNASIGVFVCECGDKIRRTLDVGALVRAARAHPHVKCAEQAGYWCLPGATARLRSRIAEHHLDRIVIAGCTPRTHESLFRRTAGDMLAGPNLIRIVNVRDLCARPHEDDRAGAISKALDQVAMAVADMAARTANTERKVPITQRVVVIGGGLAGVTAALAAAEAGTPVTLIEREAELGGRGYARPGNRIGAVCSQANVIVRTGTDVEHIGGSIGKYQVTLKNGEMIEAGAIILATGANNTDSPPNSDQVKHYAFVLCDIAPDGAPTCKHTCCLTSIRQAIEIKRASANSECTIFFRELYTAGGAYDDLVWEAQQLGVRFVRYPAGFPPSQVNGAVRTRDELTGRAVTVPCDRLSVPAPMSSRTDSRRLAEMLHLPVDSDGFIADMRTRLRPTERIERGIYVCGAVHYPCDAERATFQAHVAAARAVQHIRRETIVNWTAGATVDANRCNGCGDCSRVCPFGAITLTKRQSAALGTGTAAQAGWQKLASVDPLLCTACGNCVSVCPVQAASVPSATDEQIEAQVRAALGQNGNPPGTAPSHSRPILIFACEWSGYAAAEMAGKEGLVYPASTRIIPVNCTGRLQPGLLLKTLEMGAAGVMVLGCEPGVCHYEQGNEHAHTVFQQASALGKLMGLGNRLALKWIPPDDGAAFVQVVRDFVGDA